jgi:hypothetical protein
MQISGKFALDKYSYNKEHSMGINRFKILRGDKKLDEVNEKN